MWDSFWDSVWYTLVVFAFVALLMVLFSIIGDLFRDRELPGGWKAVWIFVLVVLPWLTALVYLIARGKRNGAPGLTAQQAAKRSGTPTSRTWPADPPPIRSRTPNRCSTRARSAQQNSTRSKPKRWPDRTDLSPSESGAGR